MRVLGGHRQLLYLGCAVVLVDTVLYAALTPLLPRFSHDLGLSKGLAGVLVAAYPFGALLGGVPGGLVTARVGPRRAVLAGLTLFSATTVVFAFADSYAVLLTARVFEGIASALSWAGALAWLMAEAPRERRGELVGTAMGAAVFGALLGPALGSAAAIAGRALVFTLVGAIGAALIPLAYRLTDAGGEEMPHPRVVAAAFTNRRFQGGLALMTLPALLFGVLAVLAPLHLSAAGWGAGTIGLVWIVGATLETIQAPLVGRVSDRRGRALPVRIALVGGALVSLGLVWGSRPAFYAPLVVAASLAYGMLFTPGIALIADGAEDAGVPQGLGFGLMNAAWAVGATIGPAAGGGLAQATGDKVPLLLSAILCGIGLVALRAPIRHRARFTRARARA
ncbi:MAG TPA: MFS transporter [Candidatus Binatia bacterium]|nr:MFS transporter [Candidatus Binatia bacterium]